MVAHAAAVRLPDWLCNLNPLSVRIAFFCLSRNPLHQARRDWHRLCEHPSRLLTKKKEVTLGEIGTPIRAQTAYPPQSGIVPCDVGTHQRKIVASFATGRDSLRRDAGAAKSDGCSTRKGAIMTTLLHGAGRVLERPIEIHEAAAVRNFQQRAETNSRPNLPPSQDVFALFSGVIDQNTVQKFFNNFALITQQKTQNKHLHLLIQSYGGTISDGIALYNLLKTAPLEVSVYNSGSVQSAAAIYFLAGKRRVASRHAMFMLHRPTCAPQLMTTERLESVLASLKIDEQRLDSILRSHLNFSEAQWSDFRNNELWLAADDALKHGLITEIGEFSPPKGTQVFSFNL
jgi:ATP-dependent protease ClpP protease subunit